MFLLKLASPKILNEWKKKLSRPSFICLHYLRLQFFLLEVNSWKSREKKPIWISCFLSLMTSNDACFHSSFSILISIPSAEPSISFHCFYYIVLFFVFFKFHYFNWACDNMRLRTVIAVHTRIRHRAKFNEKKYLRTLSSSPIDRHNKEIYITTKWQQNNGKSVAGLSKQWKH